MIIRESKIVVQGVKELEQHFHHIFFNTGVDQADESTMPFTEGRVLGNPGCKFLELRRDPYKIDLNCLSAKRLHVLQNKNKDEDPNP